MKDTDDPSNTMHYWLVEVAKRARQDAGVTQHRVAAELDRATTAVSRFERHLTKTDCEGIIDAYARACDTTSLELFGRAVKAWGQATERRRV